MKMKLLTVLIFELGVVRGRRGVVDETRIIRIEKVRKRTTIAYFAQRVYAMLDSGLFQEK